MYFIQGRGSPVVLSGGFPLIARHTTRVSDCRLRVNEQLPWTGRHFRGTADVRTRSGPRR